jgi:ribosomal protein S18 acetylase RimI-like enzyme
MMENHLFIQVRNDMESEVVISLASVVDAPAIAKLNLFFNEVEETAETIAARMSDPNCVETVILAKVADEEVGFALVRVVSSVLYAAPHAELTELYVREEYRQRGTASDLIAYAEQVAAQKGARSIFVQMGDDNEPALSLYRKNGYEEYDLVLRKRIMLGMSG